MIHIVTGRQGSGKTLYLVMKAFEGYQKGLTIYSNVDLEFPYKQLDYKDIVECKLEDSIVIIDEIQLLLPSICRNKQSRKILQGFLSQIRKRNIELYGSTQKLRKIDVRLRTETDFHYECDKYAFIEGKWIQVLHNQNLDPKIPIAIKLNVTDVYNGLSLESAFIANDIFKLYDTRQVIKIKGVDDES